MSAGYYGRKVNRRVKSDQGLFSALCRRGIPPTEAMIIVDEIQQEPKQMSMKQIISADQYKKFKIPRRVSKKRQIGEPMPNYRQFKAQQTRRPKIKLTMRKSGGMMASGLPPMLQAYSSFRKNFYADPDVQALNPSERKYALATAWQSHKGGVMAGGRIL